MTMKKLPYYIIIILGFGCKPFPSGYHIVNGNFDPMGKDCEKATVEIKKKWAVHNDRHCFYHNKKLVSTIIKNKNCFLGRDTSDIIDLFGRPNHLSTFNMHYNASTKCEEADDLYSSSTLTFNYSDGVVKNVKYSGNPPPH